MEVWRYLGLHASGYDSGLCNVHVGFEYSELRCQTKHTVWECVENVFGGMRL